MKSVTAVLAAIAAIAMLAVVIIVAGLPTMLVWNYLADPVFALLGWDAFPDINIWTAIGINLLWAIVGPRNAG